MAFHAKNQPDLFGRYDTRRYFNVRSKADTDLSQLNLPHDRTPTCDGQKRGDS